MTAVLLGFGASPALADSCPSPYNYNYNITGITLNQSSSTSYPGTITVTATLTGDADGQANLAGLCVDITLSDSGANYQPAQRAVVQSGKTTAPVTITGRNLGYDSITGTAVSGNNNPTLSDTVRHQWVAKPRPTPSPTRSPTRSPTPKPVVTTAPPVVVTASPTRSPTPSPTPSPTASVTASPVPVVTTHRPPLPSPWRGRWATARSTWTARRRCRAARRG
jgi:hypothetical protein